MEEEIFAPILPILIYESLESIIVAIEKRPSPLACYFFSKKKTEQDKIVKEVRCGGMGLNEVILHISNLRLPFGGVGESGIGSYHGEFGFKTFSHEKAVLKRNYFARVLRTFFPPYFLRKIRRFKFYRSSCNALFLNGKYSLVLRKYRLLKI